MKLKSNILVHALKVLYLAEQWTFCPILPRVKHSWAMEQK